MNILETDSEKLLVAVRNLLMRKGITSPAEIAERIAVTDRARSRSGGAHGCEGVDRS